MRNFNDAIIARFAAWGMFFAELVTISCGTMNYYFFPGYFPVFPSLMLIMIIAVITAFMVQVVTADRVLGTVGAVKYFVISLSATTVIVGPAFERAMNRWDRYDSGAGGLTVILIAFMLTPVIYSLVSFVVIHFMLKGQSVIAK
ncbi:MAG: hypothetical protein ACRCSF_01285 [Mycobacteriaceae bacterium]